ncbi:MAG: MBL fold metallo-hydrolase [Syntrophaceae bacterium]|nr:MBL fold metallo-hydrolase [Syntrophaceae bacterium]
MLISMAMVAGAAEKTFETDVFPTSDGDLTITFLGHGTLMMAVGGKVIHVDPVGQYADYARLPKADLILVTHEHSDHLDLKAIGRIRKAGTVVVANGTAGRQVEGSIVMKNGDVRNAAGFGIEAVPAYNLVHMRSPGVPYHPKGNGNGYVVTCGGKRIYIAGDTENTPEMKALKGIDIAFLPMNLPYTMTPEMVTDAAKAFRPRILYPYHFGGTKTDRLKDLLKNEKDIEVRIRKMS